MKVETNIHGEITITKYLKDGRIRRVKYIGYSEKEALKEFNTEYRYIMKYRPWSV